MFKNEQSGLHNLLKQKLTWSNAKYKGLTSIISPTSSMIDINSREAKGNFWAQDIF